MLSQYILQCEMKQISRQEGCYIHFGASLVAQMVKNPPTMQETWVQFLGWKDSLEEGMATHPSILAWRIPMDRGVSRGDHMDWRAQPMLLQTVRHD